MSQPAGTKMIDIRELSMVIAEAYMGVSRPVGMSAKDAIEEMERLNPGFAKKFMRAGVAAAQHIGEIIGVNTQVVTISDTPN